MLVEPEPSAPPQISYPLCLCAAIAILLIIVVVVVPTFVVQPWNNDSSNSGLKVIKETPASSAMPTSTCFPTMSPSCLTPSNPVPAVSRVPTTGACISAFEYLPSALTEASREVLFFLYVETLLSQSVLLRCWSNVSNHALGPTPFPLDTLIAKRAK